MWFKIWLNIWLILLNGARLYARLVLNLIALLCCRNIVKYYVMLFRGVQLATIGIHIMGKCSYNDISLS